MKDIVDNGIKKIFFIFAFFFTVSIVAVYISYLLGCRYFLLPELEINGWLSNIIRAIMFGINLYFMLSICLDIYTNKIWKHLLVIMLLYVFGYIFFIMIDAMELFAIIISGILPSAYVILLNIFHNRSKYKLIRTLLFHAVLFIYQLLMLPAKTGFLGLHYYHGTLLELLLFSIDMYIIFALIYLWKGGNAYVAYTRFAMVLPQAFDNAKESIEEVEEVQKLEAEYSALPKLEKLKALVRLFAIQIGQLFLILAVCAIGRKLITVLVLLPAFFAFGAVIKKRYHSDSVFVCSISAALVFFIATQITIQLRYSVFGVFIIAFLIVYSLYRVQEQVEKFQEIEKELDMLNATPPFKCITASADDFWKQGISKGLKDDDIDFALQAFRSGKTLKEIASDNFCSIDNVKRRKARLKDKLETT